MPRGPSPTPTNIKVLSGTPGKRPLNTDEPDVPPLSDLKPPTYLLPGAKKEWKRVLPILARLGVMTDLDIAALAAYCTAYDTFVTASMRIKKLGYVVESPNGYLQDNPYIRMQKNALIEIKRWADELGLTPSARTRVKVSKTDEGDALDDLIGGKGAAS